MKKGCLFVSLGLAAIVGVFIFGIVMVLLKPSPDSQEDSSNPPLTDPREITMENANQNSVSEATLSTNSAQEDASTSRTPSGESKKEPETVSNPIPASDEPINAEVASSVSPSIYAPRTWTSNDGARTFMGEFQKLVGAQVTIVKEGSPITFPLDLLSEADKNLLGQRISFVTTKGDSFDNVSVKKFNSDFIEVVTASGTVVVLIDHIPEPLRSQFSDNRLESLRLGSVTTVKGRTYEDVEIMRLEPDAVQIRHGGGVARIGYSDLPEIIRERFVVERDKVIAEMVEGLEIGKTYDIMASHKLLAGPSSVAEKLPNEKAIRALGGVHYLSVDDSCTVKLHRLQQGWAEIQVIEPEHLSDSHRGWIIATALKRGVASKKEDGWIRLETVVYRTPDKTKPIGILVQKAAVSVADGGGEFLRLVHGPVRTLDRSDFLHYNDVSDGAYIPRDTFTTTLPAYW